MSPKGVGGVEEWQQRVNQDISELKQGQAQASSEQSKMRDDIRELQISDKLQDREINSLKDVLSEIKGDTRYIRDRLDVDKDEELKRHRNFWWKLVTAVIIGAVLLHFGLQ